LFESHFGKISDVLVNLFNFKLSISLHEQLLNPFKINSLALGMQKKAPNEHLTIKLKSLKTMSELP